MIRVWPCEEPSSCGGLKAIDAEDVETGTGEMINRGAAHRAESHHDHVIFLRHAGQFFQTGLQPARVWAAFLTTILFSISAVCGQRTSKMLGGTEANFWRLCFAALLLAAWAHSAGAGVSGQGFWIFFVSGCIGFGFGDAALFQALPRIGSRLSVLMVLCLSSPVAALIEWLWLGTTLSWREIGCGILVLLGVVVALAPGRHIDMANHFGAGLAFGVIAAICQALGAVLSRKAFAVAQHAGENIDGITAAYQRILGGVLLTALLLWIIKSRNAPLPGSARERWRKAWWWVLLNGLSGPALGVSFTSGL